MLMIQVRCDICGVTGKMKKFSKSAIKSMREDLALEGWHSLEECSWGRDSCPNCEDMWEEEKRNLLGRPNGIRGNYLKNEKNEP
jgi:hypothetical protein